MAAYVVIVGGLTTVVLCKPPLFFVNQQVFVSFSFLPCEICNSYELLFIAPM